MGTGDVGTVDQTLTGERADLAQTLAKSRGFLRFTDQGHDRRAGGSADHG